jgi:hypothetical protein
VVAAETHIVGKLADDPGLIDLVKKDDGITAVHRSAHVAARDVAAVSHRGRKDAMDGGRALHYTPGRRVYGIVNIHCLHNLAISYRNVRIGRNITDGCDAVNVDAQGDIGFSQ